ncbi:hypothetical protein DLJ49_20595 [Rhodovulum sp. 12E13]|uniref:hypothetical protein n=1 Tax=Rhodovulum sp. 12E13 TaxID=2203891 RepID=UPI000E19BF52|nr:hypothetical protein [Rhodovulum sp. 12E13]RDC67998.1 hypothetical protein DLJ49_20595 [Rhodovulum sp. 12E13]
MGQISAHERLAFNERLARCGDDIDALRGVRLGLLFAADFSDDAMRMRELGSIVSDRISQIQEEAEEKRHAYAAEALSKYDTVEEKAACLRRLAYTVDEAVEAGLIADREAFLSAA